MKQEQSRGVRNSRPARGELAERRELVHASRGRERRARRPRGILEASSDAFLTVSTAGEIEDFNPAAARLFDTELEPKLGCSVAGLLPGLADDMPMGNLLARSRRRGGIELLAADASGRRVPVHVVVSELPGRSRYVLAIRDITGIRTAQQRALEHGRLAAIGETMTALAHESRNALQRLQSCLTLLELRSDAATRDLIRDMQDAQDQLQRLYEDVRHFAAPMRLRRREIKPANLLERVWRDLGVAWEPKRLGWSRGGAPAACRVRGDPKRLGQALRNVLENAIHASPPGGTVRAAVYEERINDEAAVRIQIDDEGDGISAEHASRAFDLLFTTKDEGTGMGLALARRIVQEHGGHIEICNAELGGARVIIVLPAIESR